MRVEEGTQQPKARRRRSGWRWFFLLLFGMTAAGIGLEIWFNLKQQLTADRVNDARRVWDEHWEGKPRDYRWEYTVENRDGDVEVYHVEVRGGKVVSATIHKDDKDVPTETFPYGTMDALFQHIAELLEADRKPDMPRVFATAVFDRRDGHVIRYVRSIRSTRERTEINVFKLEAPPGG